MNDQSTAQHSFATLNDAKAARYVSPKGVRIEHGKGGIWVKDTSGRSSYGYSYALRAYVAWESNGLDRMEYSDEAFAKTTTVYLCDEKNAIGSTGAFTELFSAEDFARGVKDAKAWIDEFNVEARF